MAATQDLCAELVCPICLDYFEDPVILAECGHNFCRSCLTQFCGEGGRKAACPQCRICFQIENLIPNQQLRNLVEIAKKSQEESGKGEGNRLCEKHQEPLKLFCKEDEVLICVVCDRAKTHKAHEVVPLEEAPQDYKVRKKALKSFMAFPGMHLHQAWANFGPTDVLDFSSHNS